MPFIRGILLFITLLGPKVIFGHELKTGDVLLQPLHCWVCSLIEAETHSPYSHMGIVIKEGSETFVLEAWQEVKLSTLDEFLSKTEKNLKVKILRHKILRPFELEKIKALSKPLIGHPYDDNFLFDNYLNGKKAYYCSELIYEVLSRLTNFIPASRPMTFNQNTFYWDKYFNGTTPHGELGISPAHFDDETYFNTLGEI